jgi:replication initiation protein RepC
MGAGVTTVVAARVLQRREAIRSPGGYLRTLAQKADTSAFSAAPMVMSLLKSRPDSCQL